MSNSAITEVRFREPQVNKVGLVGTAFVSVVSVAAIYNAPISEQFSYQLLPKTVNSRTYEYIPVDVDDEQVILKQPYDVRVVTKVSSVTSSIYKPRFVDTGEVDTWS